MPQVLPQAATLLPIFSTILRPPAQRVAMRLEREAIEIVAQEFGESFDRVEDIYRKSRSSIAHLRHHAHEPTNLPLLHKQVQELVAKAEEFLSQANASSYGTRAWRNELARATQNLKSGSEIAYVDNAIIPAEIDTFLRVVDAARKLYEADSYDFSGFIDKQIYVLAGMVLANFPAYTKTLNG